MAVDFSTAKNGSEICSSQGIFFHSRYNPQNEGEIFAKSLACDFQPKAIILISPALGYCARPLRHRFPQTKLIAIEFSPDFSRTKDLFDQYLVVSGNNSEEICQKIFFSLGEETMFLSLPAIWPPSTKVFENEIGEFLPHLRQLYEMTKTAIATRSHFSKVWLKNSFRFFKNVENAVLPKKTDLPILIAASGPTLEKSLDSIRKHKDCFFIIALSSAVEVLLQSRIIPDLIFTGDGGFWAKMHLNSKNLIEKQIPVALPCEAAVFGHLLSDCPVIPLNYGDDACRLFDLLGFPYISVGRNGTVSGIAVDFALGLTERPIFICGLDLCCEGSRGPMGIHSHTLPNNLESQNEIFDNRLKPLASRLYASALGSKNSLEIYARWFENLPAIIKSRLIRIKSASDTLFRPIAGIKEENWEDFQRNFSFTATVKKDLFRPVGKIHKNEIQDGLKNFLENTENAYKKAMEKESLSSEEKFFLKQVDYGLFLQQEKGLTSSDDRNTATTEFLFKKLKDEIS